MRFTDIFLSFPGIVLAITIATTLGPSLINAMIALTVTWWPLYARLVRGSVLSVKEEDYIEAAKAVGESDLRIVFSHVLPNILSVVIVRASQDLGLVILNAATLGYLGVGAQPPMPEWGAMVSA